MLPGSGVRKSSQAMARLFSSQPHAIGQYIGGNGSINSMGCGGFRPHPIRATVMSSEYVPVPLSVVE